MSENLKARSRIKTWGGWTMAVLMTIAVVAQEVRYREVVTRHLDSIAENLAILAGKTNQSIPGIEPDLPPVLPLPDIDGEEEADE